MTDRPTARVVRSVSQVNLPAVLLMIRLAPYPGHICSSGDGNCADVRRDGDNNGPELSSESIVGTIASCSEPFMEQLGVHL